MRSSEPCRMLILALCLFLTFGNTKLMAANTPNPDIIPIPMKSTMLKGSFELTKDISIIIRTNSEEVRSIGTYLSELLKEATGIAPGIKVTPSAKTPKGSISLTINQSLSKLGDEGYELAIHPDAVVISACKPAGTFYGIQTLRQMMKCAGGKTFRIPCASIQDKPRYEWRGMLLDSCRHFMSTGTGETVHRPPRLSQNECFSLAPDR